MLPLKNTKLTDKQKDRLRQRKITMKEVNKSYYTMLNPNKTNNCYKNKHN